MKIAFINVGTIHIDDDNLEPNLGALYIASNLQKNGYIDIQFYDILGCKSEYEMEVKIRNIPIADIYSFTVYCTNYNYVKMCIKSINIKNSSSYIVLGGPNASALPEFTLKDSKCDFVVVGEGEDAFFNIVDKLNYGCEPNINGSRIINGISRENIDGLPFPAWSLVNLRDYNRVLDGERVISILTSRGCPNACRHCNSIILGSGKKIRYRSVENIIEEIKYLQSLGYNNFRCNDDNFVCRPNIKELTIELKKLNIKYRAFAHIKDLTDETCKILADSGCQHIAIGIESMYPKNLKFLRKNTDVEIVDKNLQNVRRYGMISRVYFIVGLPFDTDETIEKYMTIASYLPFDEFVVYPLISYPGTEIWKHPEKYGYTIIDKDFSHYYQIGVGRSTCYVLQHKNFTEKDVERWVNYTNNLLDKSDKVHNSRSNIK
jgi:anaerobic magnesium-protoporphyrin IX monomethyl ester cyclase